VSKTSKERLLWSQVYERREIATLRQQFADLKSFPSVRPEALRDNRLKIASWQHDLAITEKQLHTIGLL